MTVAITGGSGFIGSHFVRHLREKGRPHRILDISRPAWPLDDTPFILGDIRDGVAVRRALEGSSAVLHLAAAHHDFGIARDTYFDVNARGAHVICEAMDELGIRKVCFFSSVAVYGEGRDSPTETDACDPSSPYGQSKLEGEGVFKRWADKGDGRCLLVIRPTVTFGPGHFANMYTLVDQIARRRFLPVGAGHNRKSLVYVDNLVSATMFLWNERSETGSRTFNAVDKPDLTSAEITRTIYEALGRRMPPVSIPLPVALTLVKPIDLLIGLTGLNLPVSTARIRKLVSMNTVYSGEAIHAAAPVPRVSLEEGIHRMVDWYVRVGRSLEPYRSIPPERATEAEATE